MTSTTTAPQQVVDGPAAPGRRWSLPAPLVDAVAVMALTTIGLLGFHASFGGWVFLATGVAGCLLGLALAWLASRLGMPGITTAAVALISVAVLGGVLALRATAIAGIVPTLDTFRGLAQGFTRGWLDLATTPPPAGDVGNLLAIPYLCGFLAGVIGLGIALRGRRPHLAVVPPLLVLGASILTGVEAPVSLMVQGSLFALITVGWWSWRGARDRQVLASSAAGWPRAVAAVALLSVAAVAGLLIGPRLPGSDANDRLLLRQYVEPELDLSRYPSPLSAVRKYLMTEEQRGTVLFTVTGLPSGTPLRLAVLDHWDGTAAGVSGTVDAESSGQFRRIGSAVPTTVTGTRVPATIEVKGYNDFWVPTAGGTAAVQVAGPRAEDVRRTLFYNTATDSAITTSGLTEGDRFTLDALLPAAIADPTSLPAAAVRQPRLAKVPDAVAESASDLTESGSAYARAAAVAEFLRTGAFYAQHGSPILDRPPGHGYKRLGDLVGEDQWIGDEEQYGALALLMARGAQVPARLVMGFRDREAGTGAAIGPATPTSTWDVTGDDLDVWLEVALQGAGWVPVFEVSPPRDQIPTQTEEPKPKPRPEVQVPPKPDPNPGSESAVQDLASEQEDEAEDDPFRLPGWVGAAAAVVGIPLLLIGLYAALVLGLKGRRRRRRREHPDPGTAIAGGWAEVLDSARDSGLPAPPPASTRREASRHLTESASDGAELLTGMARRADAAVFAPEPPSAQAVADYWADVATAGEVWLAGRGRLARWRARLNLRSLRGRRVRVPGGAGPSMRWRGRGGPR